jgi:aspartate oxidase
MLAEESNNTFLWTVKELGVLYRERVTQMGGHSVPRTLSTMNSTGRDIIEPMLQIAKFSSKISLHFNHQVTLTQRRVFSLI